MKRKAEPVYLTPPQRAVVDALQTYGALTAADMQRTSGQPKVLAIAAALVKLGYAEECQDTVNGKTKWRLTEAGKAL